MLDIGSFVISMMIGGIVWRIIFIKIIWKPFLNIAPSTIFFSTQLRLFSIQLSQEFLS
jgi:hypothetical protein